MCLTVNTTGDYGEVRIMTAEEDIECMKVLEVRTVRVDGELRKVRVTPYQAKEVPEEVTEGGRPFEPDEPGPGDMLMRHRNRSSVDVEAGFVHTYAYTTSSASAIYSEISFLRRSDVTTEGVPTVVEVWKCVIPKGEQYLEGRYGGWRGYASKSLRFLGRIDAVEDTDPVEITRRVLALADEYSLPRDPGGAA